MSQFGMCTVAFVTNFPDDTTDDPGNIVPNVTVTHKLPCVGDKPQHWLRCQTGSNMMQKTTTSKNLHPVAEMYAEEHKAGHMDRREFMSRATALSVSAISIRYAGSCDTSTSGRPHSSGRNTRMQMEVRALKDPRRTTGHKSYTLQRVGWNTC